MNTVTKVVSPDATDEGLTETSAQQRRGPQAPKRKPSVPYRHGKGYAIRRSYLGHHIFLSGFRSAAAAERALRERMSDIDHNVRPVGLGPDKTTLAQALQDYAVERLPFLKGADQEARRINVYLRAAGLRLVEVEKSAGLAAVAGKSGGGVYFDVRLVPHSSDRAVPKGLKNHRRALLTANASTDRLRAALASTPVSEVTRDLIQRLVNQMVKDGNKPATIGLERALLRVLFNHAFTSWRWTAVSDNPATKLKMPTVDNERKRVLAPDEQALLDAALADCRNQLVEPTVTLLRETAMRASEPIDYATWADVDWKRTVLHLRDAKAGQREVPLSPEAIRALNQIRDITGGRDDDRIVSISYNALAAAWRRAVKRAGVEDLHVHDLRRTAATRMALATGNVWLVKALTGHKSLTMLQRYINVGADDVVAVMHARADAPALSANAGVQPAQASEGSPSGANEPGVGAATSSLAVGDELDVPVRQSSLDHGGAAPTLKGLPGAHRAPLTQETAVAAGNSCEAAAMHPPGEAAEHLQTPTTIVAEVRDIDQPAEGRTLESYRDNVVYLPFKRRA